MKRLTRNGFTLLELVISIAIIGILAAIALPAYDSYITKSKANAAQSDLAALALNFENAFQRQLAYPVATTTSTAQTKALFTGWAPAQSDFTYTSESTTTTYTLTATGKSGNLSSCVMSLDNQNVRTVSGSPGVTSW